MSLSAISLDYNFPRLTTIIYYYYMLLWHINDYATRTVVSSMKVQRNDRVALYRIGEFYISLKYCNMRRTLVSPRVKYPKTVNDKKDKIKIIKRNLFTVILTRRRMQRVSFYLDKNISNLMRVLQVAKPSCLFSYCTSSTTTSKMHSSVTMSYENCRMRFTVLSWDICI